MARRRSSNTTGRKRRSSISAEGGWDPAADPEIAELIKDRVPKEDAVEDRLRICLLKTFMFKHVGPHTMKLLIDTMSDTTLAAGTRVITQGDDGDHFYVVESGTLECYKLDGVPEEGCAEVKPTGGDIGAKVKEYSAGGCFGELALLYNAPRAATIVTTSKCVLWTMDRAVFRDLVMREIWKRRTTLTDLVGRVPFLQSMDAKRKADLVQSLELIVVNKRTEVVSEGSTGGGFYFLIVGLAEAVNLCDTVLKEYREFDYFGEVMLLYNTGKRTATVRAATSCQFAYLDPISFRLIMGPEQIAEMRCATAKYAIPPPEHLAIAEEELADTSFGALAGTGASGGTHMASGKSSPPPVTSQGSKRGLGSVSEDEAPATNGMDEGKQTATTPAPAEAKKTATKKSGFCVIV